MSWVIEVNIIQQTTDALRAKFSNHLQGDSALLRLNYKLARIGGCCELDMTVGRNSVSDDILCGNLIEVYTENDDEARGVRYKGIVQNVIRKYDEGTVRVQAMGLWSQFEWNLIAKYFDTTAIDDVVSDIFDAFKSKTYCNSTASISLASAASLGDVELSFMNAADVMKKLAFVQNNVDYGVNASGVFYFKDQTTTKRGHYQFGVNVRGLKETQRGDEFYNSLFFKTSNVLSSGNLTLHEDDNTSVTNYKNRMKIMDAPEFDNLSNSITWAQNEISKNANPTKLYEFEPLVDTNTHYNYRGRVSLADESGSSLGDFDIESVKYNYSSGSGFGQRLEVGNKDASIEMVKLFSDIERKARVLESSIMSFNKIEHSAFDEFRQYVRQNALENDLYNYFTLGFGKGRTGDVRFESYSIKLRIFRSTAKFPVYKPGKIDEPGIILTEEINLGRELDTVRVYYQGDQWGQYDFQSAGDLEDWSNQDCADDTKGGYTIDEDTGGLIGYKGVAAAQRGDLWLKPVNWIARNIVNNVVADSARAYWSQPYTGYIEFELSEMSGNTNDVIFNCVFNRHSDGLYTKFYIDVKDANNFTFHIECYNGGVMQDSDTYDGSRTYGYMMRLYIDGDADYSSAWLYQMQSGSPVFVDTINVTNNNTPTNHYFKIVRLENSASGDTGNCKINWFRHYGPGIYNKLKLYASRDSGTTWEEYVLTARSQDPTYRDFDLSGQPSGDTLIIKAKLDWPCVLYALGAAWGGD